MGIKNSEILAKAQVNKLENERNCMNLTQHRCCKRV